VYPCLSNDRQAVVYSLCKKIIITAMNNISISCEKVGLSNLELAIKIQKTIFPKENGSLNLKASVDKSLVENVYGRNFSKSVDFWICKNEKNNHIGITGTYSYLDYPEDAWCGWYGILPENRERGYGKKLLLWTMEKAKEMGFENFRLYTDLVDNSNAVELYRKLGMVEESYTAEDMGNEKIIIFSKNLYSNNIEKIGHRLLSLKKQEEIQKRAEIEDSAGCEK
jgi:predicted acetyltransferase